MEYSAESIHFLWISYAAIVVAQVAFAGWLALRWKKTTQQKPRA